MLLWRWARDGRDGYAVAAVAGVLLWLAVSPAAAFGPPRHHDNELPPISEEIDRLLYCGQVVADASSERAGSVMDRGLLGAYFLFGDRSMAALTNAGWTLDEIQQRIELDYVPRVAADRDAGKLAFSEDECLVLAAASAPADLPPDVLDLLDCAMLFELEASAAEVGAGNELHRRSAVLVDRAAATLHDLGFDDNQTVDIANGHAPLIWAQVAIGQPPHPLDFCADLLERLGEAG